MTDAVVGAIGRNIETGIMFERLERHILLVAKTTGFPTCHGFYGEHPTTFQTEVRRKQQVFILLAIKTNRKCIVFEQINDRRAVELHVIQRWP
ncbi:hypothetical protein D3C81_1765260 [compost metagenome]